MSYAQNRQTFPQVYNYGGIASTGSFVPPVQQQTVNEYRTSNVQPVGVQRASNVQPFITSEPVPATNQRTSQFKGSRAQEALIADKRYKQYQHVHEYKYNLFSLVDEPWNRCLHVGKCGSFPGNQCIARQSRRGLWNWN